MKDTTQLENALLRECAKNKISYKKIAVKTTGTVLALLDRKEYQKMLVAIDELCDEVGFVITFANNEHKLNKSCRHHTLVTDNEVPGARL